jgi:NAD+ synthase (glutamine-hydrolysing)
MKVALAQINTHIGNFEANKSKILSAIKRAENEGADLITFPELSICGYPPLDFLEFNDFTQKCISAIQEIAKACTSIAAIVGAPCVNPAIEGKNLYNSAFFLYEGEIKKVIHKTLLPNYDVFDEYRYFEPNNTFSCISFKGQTIALTICEDLWDVDEDKMYVKWPMDELMKFKPTVMINIAASPFSYAHAENRKRVLHQTATKFGLPIFYVNHVGAQTELVFDGGSLVMNQKGNVVCELAYFKEDFRVFELDWVKTAKSVSFESSSGFIGEDIYISRIYNALILGIRDYFYKMGFAKAILGLSGGIDSAVVFALASEALGPQNVLGVLMPSPYSSEHSIADALKLAKNLNAATTTIPIGASFDTIKHTLSPEFEGMPEDLTEENMQARIRGLLLMAMSNKKGYILLNTSNKSEAAVGYGTLYGDMCGGLSVIGDVYKTQVYALAHYINREREVIPINSIIKPPSAELRPNQKDSDSLPDYEILDKVLYCYIEQKKGPPEIIAEGFDKALVNRVLKLVNTNEYKRFQTPPMIRVSNKAFGLGRRMPLVGKYLS